METGRTHVLDAAEILERGGLVAFPTETVYGLGAAAEDPGAVRRLFEVKGRPHDHPVIVHVAGTEGLERYAAAIPAMARRLTEAFWPGPLTVIVERNDRVPDEVTGGRETVGLRAPAHPVASRLLETFGAGVAAPSANRFGRVSPTTAEAVRAELGAEVDLVLDGGPCSIGVESTIVDCSGDEPVVLRVGGVSADLLADIVGYVVPLSDAIGGAPGTLPTHYAPAARIVVVDSADALNDAVASEVRAGRSVAVLAPDAIECEGADRAVGMGDADEYAHRLYSTLRALDDDGIEVVIALPPSKSGVGAAVADRLRRASGVSGG